MKLFSFIPVKSEKWHYELFFIIIKKSNISSQDNIKIFSLSPEKSTDWVSFFSLILSK